MATQKLNLTRDQLATFLGNHELIKQFERLIQIADEVAPSSDTTGISIQAGNANAAANEALAQLQRIANALEMLATAPVIQNNNSVVTDYVDLNEEAPLPADKPGRAYWNRDDGTIDVDQYGNTVLQVGQELQFYAKNTSGGLVANGTPVMFTGVVGSSAKLEFGLAVADGSVPSDYMMGVATQDIANNDFGYITNFGVVRGFNTTGTPYGQVWANGDLLYFSETIPGGWTKVQPQAPAIDVPVAVVLNAGPGGSGSIFVRMTVAESLMRLQDVYISGLANNDMLQYDSVQQRWENVPASTLAVGTATNIAGGAAGSVPYQTAPGATTFRGIGTAGQVFRVNSGATAPEWVSPAALSKVDDTNVTITLGGNPTTALLAAASLTLGWTGQLSAPRGGTGFGTYAVGDILYANTTTTLAKLADVATGNALISGGVGVAPSWGKVGLTTHVSGTLPVANGGTGLTALGAGVQTWLGTPSSANLAAAVTDETGSGSLVFATRPSFASTIGVGAATASASGAGISFPATQSASTDPNTLDDYEEAAWTPTLTGITFVGAQNNEYNYIKVGRLVHVSIYLSAATSVTIGNFSTITLPFNNAGTTTATGRVVSANTGNACDFVVFNNQITFILGAAASAAFTLSFTYRATA